MNQVLPSDSGPPKESVEITTDILGTLIVSEYANLVARQVLRPGLIITKSIENTQLLAHKVDRREAGIVVNERDPIQVAMTAMYRQRPMHIQEDTQ